MYLLLAGTLTAVWSRLKMLVGAEAMCIDRQGWLISDASEYLAPCDARRGYITSFTGSAGCAVITKDSARCWSDGRYWLQAEKQLGAG